MKDPKTVKEGSEECIADGIQILAPGCAVAPGTPTENLLAMVEVVKGH
jgi:[methyl-Co(III) methanol-specific corrinoid protein]:coenzyme M methyltransferase